MSNKALGRGLSALFDNAPINSTAIKSDTTAEAITTTLALSAITPNPDQPRRSFDPAALAELSQSIREQGLIQPLIVRLAPQGHGYQIVAGERRYRAAQMAGLHEVPVVVHDYSDDEVMLITLIENIQREDLNPVEEALAISSLKQQLQMTQDALSQKLGKSRSAIANSLRLLQLSPDALEDVRAGRLSAGHARALLSLEEPESQEVLRTYILQSGCSVREAEDSATVRKHTGHFPWEQREALAPRPRTRKKLDSIKLLQRQLNAILPCKTSVSGTDQQGKITLKYTSPEELQTLLATLGIDQK